jgi:hypothetical protein
MKYKQEIVGVWDRTHKLAEVKQKLEKELGIAVNDDKIKLLMMKEKKPQEETAKLGEKAY